MVRPEPHRSPRAGVVPGGARPRRVPPFRRAALLGSAALAALLLAGGEARAQPSLLQGFGQNGSAADARAPVTFTADEVSYDDNSKVVTASGNVEAWQNDRILRADRFTYNRDTGVATAEGNVQLLEPSGQVLFADRAELTNEMRDAAVEGVRALLAQNGKLAANGALRTDRPQGTLTDMARPVYSSCNLCAEDPTAAPLWQIRSRLATRDEEAQRIRFRDAQLNLGGVPVLWAPYLSMPDPSAPRSSGFLSPSFGQSRYLGAFVEAPYYWSIDGQSDLVVTPSINSDVPPSGAARYRRQFNFGQLEAEGSLGYLNGNETLGEKGLGGHIFSKGLFTIDENWRAGFNGNRATSETYLRAFRFPVSRVLTSNVYAEGFWGPETYARVDARAYQGLRSQDDVAQIPYVLPNAYLDHVFARDALGGTASVDVSALGIYRDEGTDTRRLATQLRYEVPRIGSLGEVWTFRAQADVLGYSARDLDKAPNFSTLGSGSEDDATGNLRAALDWRLPLVRPAGAYGRQLIEPRVQLVTGPSTGRQTRIPNEDSIDFEFTDANLFELNRFTGRDRLEGGTRVDAAFRAAWMFPNGGEVEGLVGRSFRASREEVFEQVGPRSGLEPRASDWVGRARVSPTPWLDFTARSRLDNNTGDRRLIDGSTSLGLAGLGGPDVTLTGGYLYSVPTRALIPNRFRREVYGSARARVTPTWSVGGFGRYDIEIKRPVSVGANLTYEDECLILDTRFYKSYAEESASSAYYPASTTLLFRVGFKTLGDFGFRAL